MLASKDSHHVLIRDNVTGEGRVIQIRQRFRWADWFKGECACDCVRSLMFSASMGEDDRRLAHECGMTRFGVVWYQNAGEGVVRVKDPRNDTPPAALCLAEIDAFLTKLEPHLDLFVGGYETAAGAIWRVDGYDARCYVRATEPARRTPTSNTVAEFRAKTTHVRENYPGADLAPLYLTPRRAMRAFFVPRPVIGVERRWHPESNDGRQWAAVMLWVAPPDIARWNGYDPAAEARVPRIRISGDE